MVGGVNCRAAYPEIILLRGFECISISVGAPALAGAFHNLQKVKDPEQCLCIADRNVSGFCKIFRGVIFRKSLRDKETIIGRTADI